jgi:hypothetical protein
MPPADRGEGSQPGTISTFTLRGHWIALGVAIERASDGRWRHVAGTAEVVIASYDDRSWSSPDVVVVVDPREHPSANDIGDALGRGAAAYACSSDPAVVVAHLNAVARRLSGAGSGDQAMKLRAELLE